MTTEEKIEKTKDILRKMYLFKDLTNESDEEFDKKVDYYLDYLSALYKERDKNQ